MNIEQILNQIKKRCEAATEGPNYHPETKQALIDRDLDKICEHLHTKNFESDSEWTRKRVTDSYKEAWQDAFKFFDSSAAHARTDVPMLLEMVELIVKYCDLDTFNVDDDNTVGEVIEKIAEKYK